MSDSDGGVEITSHHENPSYHDPVDASTYVSALDAKGGNQSAAASEATVKKRERPRDASGQEVDSARMAELDLEDSEYGGGGDASPNEKLKKKGRARYSQCGGGCGDFFYWASGGLLGSQTKPP